MPRQHAHAHPTTLASSLALARSLARCFSAVQVIKKKLGLPDAPAMPVGMPMGMPMMGGAPGGDAGAGDAAAAQVEEKTAFDVKLEKFDAATKIKLIKEVRAIKPDLGLKDAKELVEKAPATLATGLKKEEAEEIVKKLEAVGGVAIIE